MKKKSLFGFLTIVGFVTPLLSFAGAAAPELSNVNTLVESIGKIINLAIPIMFALAMLAFFWGLVKYLWGDKKEADEAKKTMLWGVVALFVMASVWGLVGFLGGALGIKPGEEANFDPKRLIPGTKTP